MKDNKVKISNILGSLIPDFIENDTTAGEESLFKQFLTQYYTFEEREYGTTDIAENIAFNKKISTLSEMETVRSQIIPAAGTIVPSKQVRLAPIWPETDSEVFAYDNTITVNRGEGFPEKYGLLKIDDEIITYTGKTRNLTDTSTIDGDIDSNSDTVISGITTSNISIGDIITLSSIVNQDSFEVKTISIKDETRVSSIGENQITVDKQISATSARQNTIKTFTHNAVDGDGNFNTNRKPGEYIVNGETLTGDGNGASFYVKVSDTSEPEISIIDTGKGYEPNDTIKLSNTELGSVSGVDDIIITINEIINLSSVSITNTNPVRGLFVFTRETFTFTGCVRGFNGISQIKTVGNPQFLTFNDTSAAGHVSDSIVTNLGFNFLNEFYVKFKKSYLPGLENRTFTDGISIENVLTRARDFYISKGTDLSLDILFKVLYGKNVIIKMIS